MPGASTPDASDASGFQETKQNPQKQDIVNRSLATCLRILSIFFKLNVPVCLHMPLYRYRPADALHNTLEDQCIGCMVRFAGFLGAKLLKVFHDFGYVILSESVKPVLTASKMQLKSQAVLPQCLRFDSGARWMSEKKYCRPLCGTTD